MEKKLAKSEMEKQVLPQQLDMLQKMIDLKVQNLKDLRDKQQQDSKSDIITSEISDLEVNSKKTRKQTVCCKISSLYQPDKRFQTFQL